MKKKKLTKKQINLIFSEACVLHADGMSKLSDPLIPILIVIITPIMTLLWVYSSGYLK